MPKLKKCPICGHGNLIKKEIEEIFNYKEYHIAIPNYTIYECDTCSEAIIGKNTLKKSGKILKKFKKQVEERIKQGGWNALCTINSCA